MPADRWERAVAYRQQQSAARREYKRDGDSLSRVADESVLDDVREIARDTRHGGSRGMVVQSLGNMRKARERVVPVLIELLADWDVRVNAAIALGKLKDPRARPHLEKYAAEETDSGRRKFIVRALKKLPETSTG